METPKIPHSFLTFASEILGDTQSGLSGPKIAKHSTAYAVDFGIDIPFDCYPFPEGTPNKRTALLKNIDCFTPAQQFKIILDLCDLPGFRKNQEVQDLKNKLLSRFHQYSEDQLLINQFNTYKSQPISNIAKLVKLIGKAKILAIVDDYFNNVSIQHLVDMYTLGQRFARDLRVLTTSKMKKRLSITFIENFQVETGNKISISTLRSGGHERLIFLNDKRCISPDFSLNNFQKNGHITTLGDYDIKWNSFENQWVKATAF